MLRICKDDKQKVLNKIKTKQLNKISQSSSDFVDDIILSMYDNDILSCLNDGFPEKRKRNSFIPKDIIMALAIAAKMKNRTSLTDIPYAIQDHRTLSRLGYSAVGKDSGWMTEGTIRHWIGKYSSKEFFNYYNSVVQDHIFKRKDINPSIHILDCTKIAVNFENKNYENSTISIDRKGNKMRGYKLASLRGIVEDTGIIEEVKFGTASTHDVELSFDMLKNTKCFKDGDILIMDRGFISRELINHLKNERNIDVYIPVKKRMEVYDLAVGIAESNDDWNPHPTRSKQMICHVNNIGDYWRYSKEDVDLNSCVVWDEETQSYSVFITTDLTKSAKDIVMTYELRPEIEEDFRQLKEFWKLEDFKSTKYDVISFHIVCVLFGYLFYQLYLLTKEGEKYIGKCLPVILKNYKRKYKNYLVLYADDYFCTMKLKEFIEYRDKCSDDIKEYLLNLL